LLHFTDEKRAYRIKLGNAIGGILRPTDQTSVKLPHLHQIILWPQLKLIANPIQECRLYPNAIIKDLYRHLKLMVIYHVQCQKFLILPW